MAIRARVDRHKCIGAGNCITLAPTAFDWLAGDYGKSDVVGADSIDEEVLRVLLEPSVELAQVRLGRAVGEVIARADREVAGLLEQRPLVMDRVHGV